MFIEFIATTLFKYMYVTKDQWKQALALLNSTLDGRES
jgi:hypothetical protein